MAMFHSRKKFLRAVRGGDESLVREYLANDARRGEWLGPLNDDGDTALHIAAESCRPAIMQQLLENGADSGARTRAGHTPLMLATRHASTEPAELLLAHGADVDRKDNDGFSAFGHAVRNQNSDVARLLLEHGAEVDDGKSFIHACYRRDVKTIALMIEFGVNTKIVSDDCYARHPVHHLAQYGCAEGFRLLRDADGIVDINARQYDGNTALHLAAIGGHVPMVEALLEAGARMDIENNDGLTADAAALKKDRQQTAKVIRAAREARKSEAPAEAAAPATAPGEAWVKIGEHAMAHILTVPGINRRLTEVFNFQSRERLLISENLKTGAESTLPPQSFGDIDSTAVEAATQAFVQAGGKLPDHMQGKPPRKLPAPDK